MKKEAPLLAKKPEDEKCNFIAKNPLICRILAMCFLVLAAVALYYALGGANADPGDPDPTSDPNKKPDPRLGECQNLARQLQIGGKVNASMGNRLFLGKATNQCGSPLDERACGPVVLELSKLQVGGCEADSGSLVWWCYFKPIIEAVLEQEGLDGGPFSFNTLQETFPWGELILALAENAPPGFQLVENLLRIPFDAVQEAVQIVANLPRLSLVVSGEGEPCLVTQASKEKTFAVKRPPTLEGGGLTR